MNKISRIKCSFRRKKTALRMRHALKSARRKKYCIQVLQRKKTKCCANLQRSEYMKTMKATKYHKQTRMRLCDRRYSAIDLMENFISQRLLVLEKIFQEDAVRRNIES